MRVPQTAGRPANYINHIIFVGDESASMGVHRRAFVKAWDGTVGHLAERSKAHGQETRVSAYFFNSYGTARCEVWDKDVLRMPSVEETYRPGGMTALIDAVMLALEDLGEVSQKYGEHAFMIFVLTDGQENHSRRHTATDLRLAIGDLAENVTVACFVPDQNGVFEAKAQGFPAANISVWDTSSALGVESVGEVMRDVSDMFMEGRKEGIRGYNNRPGGLFKIREFSASDVASSLVPLTQGSYTFHDVPIDCRIDEFVAAATGHAYQVGRAYYQLSKAEVIQPQKQIAIEAGGRVFSGPDARQVLGLPDYHIKAGFRASDLPAGVTVFVQSTSYNRKLKARTRLLLLR